MPTPTTIARVNRSLLDKDQRDFRVMFLGGFPTNTQNLLGRQVKSVERPAITFRISEIYDKGRKRTVPERVEFEQISITFADDNESLVNKALYDQILRQVGKGDDPLRAFEDAKFKVMIEVFNGIDEIVEKITCVGCFIANITHTEQITSDDTPNIITISINMDDAEYEFPKLD